MNAPWTKPLARWFCGLSALLLVAACQPASRTFDATLSTFNPDHFLYGTTASTEACNQPSFVWVADGGGYCLRYFASSDLSGAEEVHVYVHGDIPAGYIWSIYENIDVGAMEDIAEGWSTTAKRPVMILARPGIFGSSGSHFGPHRRSGIEARVMNEALDVIKAQHGIGRFSIIGQSGGGHIAAQIATLRSDLHCVVLSSAPLSLAHIKDAWNQPEDFSLFEEGFWDPIQHVTDIVAGDDFHMYVLADRRDHIIPIEGARAFVSAASRAHIDVTFLATAAKDKNFHGLGSVGVAVAAACAKDLPPHKIKDALRHLN